MPKIAVVFFRDSDGAVPLLDWLDTLPAKAQDKCIVRLRRLGLMGHEIRRPEADYLRNGIYELRASLHGIHYRMLYFFHGRAAVVVTHGIMKTKTVPMREIALAILRKGQFEADPQRHTH